MIEKDGCLLPNIAISAIAKIENTKGTHSGVFPHFERDFFSTKIVVAHPFATTVSEKKQLPSVRLPFFGSFRSFFHPKSSVG